MATTAIEKCENIEGTLMQLFEHEVEDFTQKSKCPLCEMKNLIYRSWRNDHICGWCREVFRLNDNKVYHLGHQDQID